MMIVGRRQFLGFCAAAPILSGGQARSATPAGALTPEQFGAKGDGRSDDSDAFAALGAEISRRGGGAIALRKTIYRIGRQHPTADPAGYALEPVALLHIHDCARDVTITGNGAVLRATPGLRFGTFDRRTGQVTRHRQPYYEVNELATPYRSMIEIARCKASVTISNLELDGNQAALVVGGPYGDVGYQIPGTGLLLIDNSAAINVDDVVSHDHPLDGMMFNGPDAPALGRARFQRLRCHDNGRQGVSIVGGTGIDFVDCRFDRSGRGAISSAPRAGVDIEAEGRKVRDVKFLRCTFSDNAGVGLLAAEGDAAGISCTRCTMIGTRNWSAWPSRPLMRFDQCVFVGAIANAFGDADPARATQFLNCRFSDDPSLAPHGAPYGGGNPDHPIAILPYSRNARFAHCHFEARHSMVLPWSVGVIYQDCSMVQTTPKVSYPRGIFVGTTRIEGRADLNGSSIHGSLYLNGKPITQAMVRG